LGPKINRVAGRFIKKSFCEWHECTIDALMMRIPTYRASGSDREECEGCEGR
jgi:hypothetical protein